MSMLAALTRMDAFRELTIRRERADEHAPRLTVELRLHHPDAIDSIGCQLSCDPESDPSRLIMEAFRACAVRYDQELRRGENVRP